MNIYVWLKTTHIAPILWVGFVYNTDIYVFISLLLCTLANGELPESMPYVLYKRLLILLMSVVSEIIRRFLTLFTSIF